MRTILSIAIYEFRVMLSLRLTPLVVGVAWMLIFLQLWFADNSSHGVNTLAGEWSGWARSFGPLAQLGVALIAVWAGAARIDSVRRDSRGESIAALPLRATTYRFAIFKGRMLFATVVSLVPLLPMGWLHATAGVATGLGDAMTDLVQIGSLAVAVMVALGYLVSGTYLMALLLPRTWLAVLVGLALALVWLGAAWFAFHFGSPGLDRTLYAAATSNNPFWLIRSASLGLLPAMGIAVAVGSMIHLIVALRVGSLVVREYDYQIEKHRLRYPKWKLVVVLVPAGVLLAGLCVAGVFSRPYALDLTRAEVTKPGPRAHEIQHAEAWIDPVNRFDGPLLAHYFERLRAVPGTDHDRVWHPSPHRRGWVGVDLTNKAGDQRVVIDIRGTLAASPWLVETAGDDGSDPDIRRLPGGSDVLTAFETLALGVADRAEWTDDSGKTHRPRENVVVVGTDAGRPMRTFLRAEGYHVDTLGSVALDSAARLRTVALVSARGDLTPEQVQIIREFQQQGGTVLVMLPAEQAREAVKGEIGGFELPTMAGGKLPVPDTQLARLLEGWGMRCSPARWSSTESAGTPASVMDVLGYEHWKSIASQDTLSWSDDRSGDVNVAIVVRHWAIEPNATGEGNVSDSQWVPLVTAETAVLTTPGEAGGERLDLRPAALWVLPGADFHGTVALSALEPFARAALDGQPALIGDDERDLLGNIVARLADRPPSAQTQRRKRLVMALPGVGLDHGFVILHQILAYVFVGLGLLMALLRSRRRY